MNFTSINQLNLYVSKMISIALQNISQRLSEELMNKIDIEYYVKYKPRVYKRTLSFLYSATSSKVSVHGNTFTVSVYIDYNKLNYEEATGYDVVKLASAGYHGNFAIYRKGFFWKSFQEEYPEPVIKQMIIEELKKLGLKII